MSIFNIRVYALFINEKKEVLITDEFRFGKEITKFPGGGLIWGEGVIDCLKRECKEELECDIKVLKHFYTTDFFQISAFHTDHQIISIYYMVKNTSPFAPALKGERGRRPAHKVGNAPSPFRNLGKEVRTEVSQTFRWVSLSELNVEEFTFPIDKKVALMLAGQD